MNFKRINFKRTALLTGALAFAHAGMAFAEGSEFTLSMKGGTFAPAKLEVPAHQKIHLTVKNEETAQVEFESYPLNQEQKINSGGSTDMYIGPLEPGEYPVFDDNNEDAKGVIVAK